MAVSTETFGMAQKTVDFLYIKKNNETDRVKCCKLRYRKGVKGARSSKADEIQVCYLINYIS